MVNTVLAAYHSTVLQHNATLLRLCSTGGITLGFREVVPVPHADCRVSLAEPQTLLMMTGS